MFDSREDEHKHASFVEISKILAIVRNAACGRYKLYPRRCNLQRDFTMVKNVGYNLYPPWMFLTFIPYMQFYPDGPACEIYKLYPTHYIPLKMKQLWYTEQHLIEHSLCRTRSVNYG